VILIQFLARKMVPVINHPPYYSNLSPPDYLLFPKLKMELKRKHFVTIETIQEAVDREVQENS